MDDRRDGRDAPRKTGGRRTDYGVVITNLPRGCSWQDLKDFMRKAGDVVFTDVDRNGEGVVDFGNRADMENAIRTLDDTEFKNYSESSYIRVKAANKKRDRSDDARDRGRDKRSPSRSRSVSRSRSPIRKRSPRSRSRSASRSPSPEKNGSSAKEEMAVEDSKAAEDKPAADESAPAAAEEVAAEPAAESA